MLIDLTDVLKNEEKIIQKEVLYESETFQYGTETFPIIEKTPFSISIENKGNRELKLTGKMKLVTEIPCGRCLEDVKTEVNLNFEKSVDMKMSGKAGDEALGDSEAVAEERNYIDGYNLDVDKLVDGELLLSWPVKVLCDENCKGLCNTCGVNLNQETCDCDDTDLDPRMAKIRDIFSKFKEV